MAFDTRLTLKTWLTGQLPTGAGGASATTVFNDAITDAVGYVGAWMRDTQRLDFVGDGTTTRFLLPGVDCKLKDAAEQETPAGLATAYTLTAPPTAPGVTVVASGGSIGVGVYYLAVAYTATINGAVCYTAPSAYATVVVTSGTTNRFTATWTAPDLTKDPGAGSLLYVSPSSGAADIRALSAGVSGSTATQSVTALPASSQPRPLKDYTALFPTYNPLPNLEQDIGVDGTASVGNATMQVGTAPSLGDRFRAVYDRKPALPTADGDTISVEQGEMRLVALMFAAAKCIAVAEVGDTTLLSSVYQTASAAVQDMQKKATPTLRPRPRMPDPRSSLSG